MRRDGNMDDLHLYTVGFQLALQSEDWRRCDLKVQHPIRQPESIHPVYIRTALKDRSDIHEHAAVNRRLPQSISVERDGLRLVLPGVDFEGERIEKLRRHKLALGTLLEWDLGDKWDL